MHHEGSYTRLRRLRLRVARDKLRRMGTPAAIGFLDSSGGWAGTYVGYDGYPEGVGVALLNLASDLDHDLEALREHIMRPSDGWRSAFGEAYEEGDNTEWFDTGRKNGPPLCHADDFVRRNVAFWYLFDLEKREMRVHGTPDDGSDDWPEIQRVRFVGASGIVAIPPADDPLDWRNRRQAWGSDDPQTTAQAICDALNDQLPVEGKHMQLRFEGDDPTLDENRLTLPLRLYADTEWQERRDTTEPLFGSRLTDIVEHHLHVSMRHLSDRERCLQLFESACQQLHALAHAGFAPTWAGTHTVDHFFPRELLDLHLDSDALSAAAKAKVREALAPDEG